MNDFAKERTQKVTQEIKLHIGCGDRYIPGFIHTDVRELPHVDFVTSADKLNMFEDNSVDLVYACHLLEHFRRNQTEDVLKEWYRVLKPGGILRVAVPDFQKLVEVYLKTENLKLILGPLFGRQDYPENTHYIVFDFAYLSEVLTKVGFKNIRRYDWRQTIHKDYDDYSQAYVPHMDKENGILISLNVECEKR
ncbi:MAG TPA: methyltransferase domain-containing protein [Dehalococcoidia bacterium]|nr:methyltransferase domain-containing protein [Dehalococcoidia bacterium]